MEYQLKKEEKYSIYKPLDKNINRAVSPTLKSQFIFLRTEGIRNLIIDISEVQFIDSDGLSALLLGRREFEDNNSGSFVLTGLSTMVKSLLEITKLDDILKITPTVEEAIELIYMEELEREITGESSEDA